jgi:hypothetical protein
MIQSYKNVTPLKQRVNSISCAISIKILITIENNIQKRNCSLNALCIGTIIASHSIVYSKTEFESKLT